MGYLTPGAQGVRFPELKPYLGSPGIVAEHGARPPVSGRVGGWAEGPGFLVPVAR